MRSKNGPSTKMSDPVDKYASELHRHIGLKDEKAKDQIINDIVNRIRSEKEIKTYDQMVSIFGRPSNIGARLSDPSNWILDMGTPLRPNIDLPSFFSSRGRILIMSIFIFSIAGLFGLMILGIARDPILIGSLIILLIFWIVATSFINDHLAYFSVLRTLKDQNMEMETIDMEYLKRNIIIGSVLAVLLFSSILFISYFTNRNNLFILLPLSISSLIAFSIASNIIHREGKNVIQ